MKPVFSIKHVVAFGLLASASICSHAAGAIASPYSSLYVFGDSLSDNGNNKLVIGQNGSQVITGNTYVPTQPYGSGVYSNAGVWVSSFAAGLGLASYAAPSLGGGGDYAYGGARTTIDGSTLGFPPSATTQLNGYLGTVSTISSSALFVIAIGGNDVRAVAQTVFPLPPADAAAAIATASAAYALGVGNMVDALQAKGAKNIVVWDAPNVGKTPAALTNAAFSTLSTNVAVSFNAALSQRLLGEAGVTTFDVFGLFNATIANPAANGLTNVTDACGALANCDPSKYLFWDGIHPTSAGQALLANSLLAAVPEPSSMLMLTVGIALLVVRRRRA